MRTPEPLASSPALRPVLLIRPDGNDRDATLLASVGIPTVIDPWLEVSPVDRYPIDGVQSGEVSVAALTQMLLTADAETWLIITSPRTWNCWSQLVPDLAAKLATAKSRGLQIATTGATTSRTIPGGSDFEPSQASAAGLLQELPQFEHALLPGSVRRADLLARGLRRRGVKVTAASIYDTVPVCHTPATAAKVRDAEFSAILLRSGTAVAALAKFAVLPEQTLALAVGASTYAAAQQYPWRSVALPVSPALSMAEALARAVKEDAVV